MNDALIQIQILYEIAMSIDTSLDMRTMLQRSLSTYLRKFSCAAGAILTGKTAEGGPGFELLYAIPRAIENNSVFKVAMDGMLNQFPKGELHKHQKRLPHVGASNGRYFHIMELPGFGLLLLFRHGSPLDPSLIKSLAPLNAKLASACQSCLRKERIEAIANDLKIENRERRKAEEALAASHEQLESIFESLAAVVYVADLDTHEIIFTNRHMNEIYGDDLEGKTCYKVMRGESHPCPECQNDRLLDDQGLPTGAVVWEGYNPKFSRWFVNHGRAIPWRDGRLVRLQISTDVSRIKQLEQERIEAAQRQQAQRLESLGSLAGGIAHEFNNLLMGMMGCVSLMKFDMEDQHPFRVNLDRIEMNVRDAAALTEKLLGCAQKGRYHNQIIQVNIVLRNLVNSLAKTNPNINVELGLDEDLAAIQADPHQIELALSNLLTNACDAMPDGGNLKIRTANVSSADLVKDHDNPQAQSYVQIVVQDSGSGMTEETKERIFDPFYTTKPFGRGAGLGMAATYGVIKGHQGFIEVDSTLGRGSKLVVLLPAMSEVPDLDPPGDNRSRGMTILLVDDEPTVRDIGEQMLDHLGHKVTTAEGGKAAVAIFEQQRNVFDLVILDVSMPGMAGEETYDRLKAIDAGAKVLISSGFSAGEETRAILVKGADGFLQKPFSIDDLRRQIEMIFETQ